MTASAIDTPPGETLLRRGEVARRFRVDPKTVTRWANANRLTAVRTPSGERRYLESEVLTFLTGPPALAAD
jgi:predicted site-specific integrase-resolvase